LQFGDDHNSHSYNYMYMLNEIMILSEFLLFLYITMEIHTGAKTLCDLHVHPTDQMQDLHTMS
jgi:hypothetical protein